MNEDNRYRLHHRNRTYPDRRAQKRNLCSDLIQVRWKSAEGARHEEIAIMEDYSPSGASLFMGVPIERGTQVRLSPKGEDLLGVVRYCSVAPTVIWSEYILSPSRKMTIRIEVSFTPSTCSTFHVWISQ